MRKTCPDIIGCVQEDHQSLRGVLRVLVGEEMEAWRKKKVFRRFLPLLSAHTYAEERSVMESRLQKEDTRDRALQALEEHELIAVAQGRVLLAADEEQWQARMAVFCDVLETHLRNEEARAFGQLQSSFSEADREELARRYLEARNQYQFSPLLAPVESSAA